MQRTLLTLLATSTLLASAAAADNHAPFVTTEIAELREPWAMAFLPDGRLLVTEKHGTLHVVTQDGDISSPIAGVPEVEFGGQGGLGDVALHPDFPEKPARLPEFCGTRFPAISAAPRSHAAP